MEDINFDRALPGSHSSEPDKDEMEMMNDIMDGEVEAESEKEMKPVVSEAKKRDAVAVVEKKRVALKSANATMSMA